MPIITFWSNTKKQTGQTMSMAAIASSMAVEHNYKILMVSTKYDDDTLELCFGADDKNKKLIKSLIKTPTVAVDNGIEGLSKIVNSGRISPDVIQNYTHIIYKNRLEVLYSYRDNPERPTEEEFLKVRNHYREIVQNANKIYDIVFVDLEKGLAEDVSRDILGISDVIVVNMEQKIDMINDFMEIKKKEPLFKEDNIIINIGRFDNFSKYSLKNISRYLEIKKDIVAIPYNTLYFEAANEESVADLFLKMRKINGSDRNGAFVNSVQEAGEKIIYKLQELQMKM